MAYFGQKTDSSRHNEFKRQLGNKLQMMIVINEPQAEYKTTKWRTGYKELPIDYPIHDIKNGIIIFIPPAKTKYTFFSEKPRRKLSALRGKLSKQSGQGLKALISKLREEWERDF